MSRYTNRFIAYSIKSKHTSQFLNYALCLFLSIALAAFCPSTFAFAKQTDTDIVGGYTASQRGLTASSLPSITAKSAYVQDSEGNVYFERNADEQSQIASVTKVMTCIIALENADLEKELSVSEWAASIGESTAQLKKGDKLTLKNALIGLMIPSGNDAATVIAENIGADMVSKAKSEGSEILDAEGKAIDLNSDKAGYLAFVAKMNEKAQELGMTNTLFTNPHGLDVNEFAGEALHSSARDVSTMSVYGMQNETFREIVALGDTSIVVNRDGEEISIDLEGTDELIGTYEGACGIKTGYTQEAGGCFTGAVLRDEIYLYVVVLGASSNEQKLEDAKTVYEWVYGNIVDFPLVNTDTYISPADDATSTDVPVLASFPHLDWLDKSVKATIDEPDKTVKVNAIFGNISQIVRAADVSGDVKVGDVVGVIEYYQGDELITSQDLIACENVEAPNFIESLLISVQRLFASISGASTSVETCVYNKTEPILLKA